MKLLLTSAGITNPSIAQALFELVGKPPEETKVAFIPTAANAFGGNKMWVINDLIDFKSNGVTYVDIVDISAVPRENWQPRLEVADVICVGGGHEFHLMRWMAQSGLHELLPELLKTKVYVGISAGSIVTGPMLYGHALHTLYGEYEKRYENTPALELVPFNYLAHLNHLDFPHMNEAETREAFRDMSTPTYALDDNSALKVVDGNVEVVGEGKWMKLN